MVKAYALVYWTKTKTISVLDTSSFKLLYKEGMTYSLPYGKKNYAGKVLLYSDDENFLSKVSVSKEGQILTQPKKGKMKNSISNGNEYKNLVDLAQETLSNVTTSEDKIEQKVNNEKRKKTKKKKSIFDVDTSKTTLKLSDIGKKQEKTNILPGIFSNEESVHNAKLKQKQHRKERENKGDGKENLTPDNLENLHSKNNKKSQRSSGIQEVRQKDDSNINDENKDQVEDHKKLKQKVAQKLKRKYSENDVEQKLSEDKEIQDQSDEIKKFAGKKSRNVKNIPIETENGKNVQNEKKKQKKWSNEKIGVTFNNKNKSETKNGSKSVQRQLEKAEKKRKYDVQKGKNTNKENLSDEDNVVDQNESFHHDIDVDVKQEKKTNKKESSYDSDVEILTKDDINKIIKHKAKNGKNEEHVKKVTKVELIPGNDTIVVSLGNLMIIENFRDKPKEMVRRIALCIFTKEQLANMSAKGSIFGRQPFPDEIRKTIYEYQFNACEKEKRLTQVQVNKVLTQQCSTIRNPKKKKDTKSKEEEKKNSKVKNKSNLEKQQNPTNRSYLKEDNSENVNNSSDNDSTMNDESSNKNSELDEAMSA